MRSLGRLRRDARPGEDRLGARPVLAAAVGCGRRGMYLTGCRYL